MATIPRLNRRVAPSGAPALRVVDSRLGGEAANAASHLVGTVGAGIDQGLSRVRSGEIAEQRRLEQEAAEAEEKERKRQLASQVTSESTEATIAFEDEYQRLRSEAPAGAAGFRQSVEKFVDDSIKQRLDVHKDDEDLQFAMGQKYQGLRKRMVLRAAKDERGAALAHAENTYSQSMDALSSAVVSNPDELDSYINQATALIEDQAPFMTAEERAGAADRAKSVLANSAIAGMVDTDPAGVLADLKGGRFDKLIDGGDKARGLVRAQNELDRRVAKAEAKKNAAKKVIAGEVKDALFVMDRGHIPQNFNDVQKAAAQFPEMDRALKESFQDVQDIAAFGRFPSEVRNEILRTSTARKNPTRRDLEREQKFAKRSAEIDRMLADDPLAAAIETGVLDELAPLEGDMSARREAASIVEEAYGVETSGLLKDEAQKMARDLADMTTPEKLQQLGAMQQGLGDRRMRLALGDIAEDDPTVAAAVSISMDNPRLAAEVFEGQQVAKAIGKDVLPSASGVDGYNALANEHLGDVLEFARPEDREAMVQSALSIELSRRNKLGLLTKEDFSPEVFQEVLGEVVGGVVSFNDEKIIPPAPDLDEDGFEEIMEAVADEDMPSLGGPFLDRDGDAVDWAAIQDSGHLKSFGAGRYFVFLGDRPLLGGDGQPAELSFGDHLDVLRSRIDLQRRRGFLEGFGLGAPSDEDEGQGPMLTRFGVVERP
ncbi:MAG: hypothetical protein ACR2QF_04830 [Geminicoccaceae bacterium]